MNGLTSAHAILTVGPTTRDLSHTHRITRVHARHETRAVSLITQRNVTQPTNERASRTHDTRIHAANAPSNVPPDGGYRQQL